MKSFEKGYKLPWHVARYYHPSIHTAWECPVAITHHQGKRDDKDDLCFLWIHTSCGVVRTFSYGYDVSLHTRRSFACEVLLRPLYVYGSWEIHTKRSFIQNQNSGLVITLHAVGLSLLWNLALHDLSSKEACEDLAHMCAHIYGKSAQDVWLEWRECALRIEVDRYDPAYIPECIMESLPT